MKKPLLIFMTMAAALCLCAQNTPEAQAEQDVARPTALEQPAEAASENAKSKESEEKKGIEGKISISADRMEMVLEKIAKLDGNVEIVFIPEGKTLEELRKKLKTSDVRVILNADRMTVFFPEKTKGTKAVADDGKAPAADQKKTSSSAPSKIHANGRVKIHTPDGKSATGEQAVWDFANGNSIMLEGKCTILSDGHVMTSPKVTYNMEENRFVASRAVITLPVGNSALKDKELPGLDALPKAQEKK